ncbi:MAG TPA: glycoside hydrolase family 3 C-terminal domain-containing protein [Terracidiphilus sp.]|jgi:beta-glucosidase|nr:glycoside hydrolase family 3 C-terminal domain-containing protein [Terracidiphilus sp.]
MHIGKRSFRQPVAVFAGTMAMVAASLTAQTTATPADRPWMNTSLPPEQRAELVLKEMTLDEKIALLHGNGMAHAEQWQMPLTHLTNGGAGYTEGVPRLGIPPILISDAAYGVRDSGANGRYATALPSDLGAASSWNPQAACAYGSLIGRELRAQGYNMTLGGGVNLTREPRNGRTFEYAGEDPLLAGTMVGNLMRCEQAEHVMGDIKHYALNDQETGRNIVNVVIGKRAMQESDLLAFHIAIGIAHPAAVMCSYNRVHGDYACENPYLLRDVLKGEWGFKGFVISDWGGTHSTVKASAAGLDQEQPLADFYGPALRAAVDAGTVPMSEIDDHARRVLYSEFLSGIVDHPVEKSVVDVEGGLALAQKIEEHSIVLLRNEHGILPLDASWIHRIAIIGGHADVGMISGGGSAQVDPPGGNAIMPPGQGATHWQDHIWFPTSPLKALRASMPEAAIDYNSGDNPAAAAAFAKNADVAIVFAAQWESEGVDLPSLALPDHQDALIAAVAAANPHTIVVLETGTAVTMPWLDHVSGVVEAWYAGSSGHIALANVLTGAVNPTGKLAMTFPRSEADLPRPVIAPLSAEDEGQGNGAVNDKAHEGSKYSVHYDEGLEVGYKWYETEHKPPLFPFGFGLSYTTYAYSGLKVDDAKRAVSFTVRNTGKRAGTEIAEVYATLPAAAGEPFKRLAGWTRVELQPGESKTVTVPISTEVLAIFNEKKNGFELLPGAYGVLAGPSSVETPLRGEMHIP